MMKPLAVCGVIVLAGAAQSRADQVIAYINYTGVGTILAGFDSFVPFMSYGDPGLPNPAGFVGNRPLTFLDLLQGNTYDLTGDLAGFAASITNGGLENVYIGFTVNQGVGSVTLLTEPALLAGNGGVGNPDLAGWTVTRISLIATAYASLGGNQFEVSFVFSIIGVPAPAGAALLGSAGLSLAGRRRRTG